MVVLYGYSNNTATISDLVQTKSQNSIPCEIEIQFSVYI